MWKANLLKWLSIHLAVLHSEVVAQEDLLPILIGEVWYYVLRAVVLNMHIS